jgi:hypothetical protein
MKDWARNSAEAVEITQSDLEPNELGDYKSERAEEIYESYFDKILGQVRERE